VNGVTYTYDKNGNLASTSAGVTNTWDYNDRLLSSQKSGTTTTYTYDTDDQRVTKLVNGVTTKYPSIYYETTNSTTTKNIYAGDTLVASIVGSGATTTLTHIHVDHLDSTSALTTDIGLLSNLYTYYPYGAPRIDGGGTSQPNRFIGQDYDSEDQLSYLNARYYDGARGQFLSQDPVFNEIGLTDDGRNILRNPQLANSYSYAGDNPVTYKDPTGRFLDTILDVGFIAYDVYSVASAYVSGGDVKAELGYLGLDVAGAAIPFATGLGLAARVARTAEKVEKTVQIAKNAENGARREAEFAQELSSKYGNSSVQKEVYLRTADGRIARDAYGKARRVDFAVVKDGKVKSLYEVTSKTANKTSQVRKESRIRNSGGTYIRDRRTGRLINASHVKTQLHRRH
jgi:RHS repeat-associated protein